MLSENLTQCRDRIKAAARHANRDSASVTLVAVTKNVGFEHVCEAIDSGVDHIGESRVQEALSKFEAVNTYAAARGLKIFWHMIGHLQTNKAKEAVKMFDLIHSLDSLHLAEKLDKEAESTGKVQDVLLEVKTSPEVTKYGFAPDEVAAALGQIKNFKNLRVKGLMTIAPEVSDPEQARPYFRKLRDLASAAGCPILSMGMTDDFEAAIAEGSTIVRIGRGIFGERRP